MKAGPYFPRGRPIIPGDRGGLMGGLRFSGNTIEFDFGCTLEYLLLDPAGARAFSALVRRRIKARWGDLAYSDHDFPLRVQALPAEQVIKVTLPAPCEGLADNPHMFLVLADRLDAAAAELG